MRFKTFCVPIFILCFIALIGCEPPPRVNEYREKGFYPHPNELKSDIAFLVLEWAERRSGIMASGSLANREKGIFRTAKHFTDEFGSLGPNYCKVLFNGKVYTAKIKKVSPIHDAALIEINSPFSSDNFPETRPLAKERPKFGDKIYIRGLHPHPFLISKENQLEGFPDSIVPIIETYFGVKNVDPSRKMQAVFDNLEGKAVKPNPDSIRKNPFLSDEQKRVLLFLENDSYVKVLTARDHKFSFGGLSGGEALNEKGEIIGVITAQDIFKFEYDDRGFFLAPDGIEVAVKKQLFDTIYITPVEAIRDLEEFAREAR